MRTGYFSTDRYVTSADGVLPIYRLAPYRCITCGQIIAGEFSGDYIGEQAAKRAQKVSEQSPCFTCRFKAKQSSGTR